MKTPRLTASRLELADRCPGSFALPHVYTKNEAAVRGTAIHEYIADSLEGLQKPAVVGIPELGREICEALDIEELHGTARPNSDDTLHVEIALAWMPEDGTGWIVPAGGAGHRDYSNAPPRSVVGTADAVCVEDSQVRITDWKTGRWEVPDPADNLQLLFLALAAARAFDKPEAVVQIVRIRDDGSLTERSAELSAEDLERVAELFKSIHERVEVSRSEASEPEFSPGAHCRFCPAFHACPAMSGAAQALVMDPDPELSPEKAREIWSLLQAVEVATKRVRQTLTEYVSTRPVPVGGGKELRLVESQRDYIDAGVAMPILREVMGEAADEAAAVSKTSLKSAVRKDMLPDLLKKIEDAGGVEARYSESLREVRT